MMAWPAAALAVAVIVLISIVGPKGGVIALDGSFQATIDGRRGQRSLEVSTGETLGTWGVARDERITIRIPITVPSDGPVPALSVRDPGAPMAASLDRRALHAWPPTDGTLLIELPPRTPPGPHVVGLTLAGTLGHGALRDLSIGPPIHLAYRASRQDAAISAALFAIGLIVFVHLALTGRRSSHPASALLGSMLCMVAITLLMSSDLGRMLFGSLNFRMRIDRAATALIGPMLYAFGEAFSHDRPRVLGRVWLGTGVLFAVLGLTLPLSVHDGFFLATRVILALAGLGYLVQLALALQRGVTGSVLLAVMTIVPVVYGIAGEWLPAAPHLAGALRYPLSAGFFAAGASIALTLRLAEGHDRHRRLIEGSADAIVVVESHGYVMDANPAAVELFGTDTLYNLVALVHPGDQPIVKAHVARGPQTSDRSEFRVRGQGREVVVESIATPLGGGTALLVLRDVSRRRKMDEGLLHAARMETVAVLVGGIAHDFNNMLGTLLAHLGFLQAVLPEGKLQGRLKRMENTIERASLLVRRLLTVSGGTRTELSAVDLGAVARYAVELVEPTLPSGVTLQVDLPADLSPVLGSAEELQHVIVNLMVNARDAIGERGHILLAARDFRLATGERGSLTWVEDDGPGVPESIREEIFDPFFTTKGPNRGTGLGLAVAAQILRAHHGRIWLEQAEAGGARFCMALRHGDAMDLAPAPLPDGRRVLLVEDEEALLEEYTRALLAAGYDVTARSTGADAMKELEQIKPDILVTDVVMPGVSGLELAGHCRSRYPGVPVLLVSGFIPEGRVKSLDDGTWHRLDKPVRTARLVSTVGRLIRRAERARRGELDITEVTYLFPPLEELTSDLVRNAGTPTVPPRERAPGPPDTGR